ncbi:MAG: 16S rRNA (uracil(1498)-N(3))-methyltransferase [Syntrophotaleaceae bacterium]
MRRFFVPADSLVNDIVTLSGETLHHLAVVLRLSRGDEILLLDGRGNFCHCRISILEKNHGLAEVLRRWHEAETACPVHLLQGLPKADKLELILQKGTELGISSFSPLDCERSVVRLADSRQDQRHQRWQKIVREAARQSCRSRLPQLLPVRSLPEAVKHCEEELRLMLWEEESRPLADLLPPSPPSSIALLVGPEGGFSADEAAMARDAGFVPVRIGPRILRSETAGFAAAAILQYLYGDLGLRKKGP